MTRRRHAAARSISVALVLTGILFVVSLQVAASPAEAIRRPWGYFLSKTYAKKFTTQAVRKRYADDYLTGRYIVASCRPWGRSKARPGYWYHAWVCDWGGEEYWTEEEYPGYDTFCYGRLMITGSSGNYFYHQVIRGIRCGEPY